MKHQLLTFIYAAFTLLLLHVSFPAGAESMAESAWEKYEELKAAIEADPERNQSTHFNKDIETLRSNLAPGFNFGNEMDWTYRNQKVRKYGLRFSLMSGERELFTAEKQFDLIGEIKGYDRKYAALKLTANKEKLPAPDMPIDSLRVTLFNPMKAAVGTEVSLTLSSLKLADSSGLEIFSGKRLPAAYPVRVSTEGTPVVSFPVRAKVLDFTGDAAELRVNAQLEGFLSDYWDHPERVFWETYNGMPATKAELAFLKEQGFRTVRLPVTWAAHMDATGTIDPGWFETVNKVVERTLGFGFTVIVNIHHDTGRLGWINADPDEFSRLEGLYRYLVLQIAENFKHCGSSLILEGPNEVTSYTRSDDTAFLGLPGSEMDILNKINQIFVEEVRRTGYRNTDRFLMVSPWFSLASNIPFFVTPQDNVEEKILTSIHDFTIWEDGGLKSFSLLWFMGSESLQQYHLVMGEFGISREKELTEKITFMERNMALAADLGIPMLLWDDGGNFAMMKNQAAEWDEAYGSDLVAEAMLEQFSTD